MRVIILSLLTWLSFSVMAAEDKILAFTVQENLGTEEVPLVKIAVEVDKVRDLYVSVQDLDNGWKQVASTMKRIKKSGQYHFEMEIDNLKPGNYRWAAYLTPRGKNWNDKIGEQLNQNMTVVDQPKYVKVTKFSSADRIMNIVWPKEIKDNDEYKLTVKYEIMQPRDISIILYNRKGWKELGEIKVLVTEPGQLDIPMNNILEDYPAGEYAWTVNLYEKETKNTVTKQMGRVFEIIAKY